MSSWVQTSQFLVEDVYLRICEFDHFHAIDAPNAAIIYQHANYQGKAKTLLPGKYDINDIGIENDTLSSIKVPNDWEVTLYLHHNFTGGTKVFTSSSSYVGNDFNDQTSSFVLED